MTYACLKTYLSQCRPYRLPPPWDVVTTDRQAYVGPASIEELSRKLLEDHSERELVEAGLFRREADGTATLHSGLATPDATLVALISRTSDTVIDLLTEEGCVISRRTTLLSILRDCTTRHVLNTGNPQLFLTGGLQDSILLRSMGLAAVPVWGLTRITEQELKLLENHFQIRCRSSDRFQESTEAVKTPQQAYGGSEAISDTMIRLVLVNWSPIRCSFESNCQIHCAIQFLLQLEEYFKYEVADIEVWAPTLNSREALEFGLAHQQPGWIKAHCQLA